MSENFIQTRKLRAPNVPQVKIQKQAEADYAKLQ
jgi:hypothetical protein